MTDTRNAGGQGDKRADEDEDAEPPRRISFDRYKIKTTRRSTWVQAATLLAMLAALVLVMLFKGRCGDIASQFMGGFSSPPSAGTAGGTAQSP